MNIERIEKETGCKIVKENEEFIVYKKLGFSWKPNNDYNFESVDLKIAEDLIIDQCKILLEK